MSATGTAVFIGLSTSVSTAGTSTAAVASTSMVATASTGAASTGAATAGAAAFGTLAMGALAAAAAVGAGIVIAKGIMWCGDKMDENYQNACKQYTTLQNKAIAESRADTQQLSNYLTSELEYISASEFAASEQAAAVSQQELERALTRARATLANVQTAKQNKAVTEQKILVARLRAEIKTGRGILPTIILEEAEKTLQGSPKALKAMLDRLEAEWGLIHEKPALQTRAIQQIQQCLTLVSAKLRTIETVLQQAGETHNPTYQTWLHQIENQVLEVRDELRVQPGQALLLVNAAQQEAEGMLTEVSNLVHKRWNEQQDRVNEQIGILEALFMMVHEAESAQQLDPQRAATLKQSLETQHKRAQALLQGKNKHMQDSIVRFTVGVEYLKQDIFAAVKTSQQRTVSTIIQDTLVELGYQSDTGEQPIIQLNGDVMHVEVMASRGMVAQPRDDKVISFDVSRDGQVSYNFSGYVGAACLEDARTVFAALHKKGVYLLDEAAVNAMQNIPIENIVEEMLQQPQFQVSPVKNKTQAELAETIKGVLDKMGYSNVRVSSVGGSIEMEAFEGKIGYRVVMSPEGEVQIFKDAQQANVTDDTNDPISKASHTVQEQSQEPEIKKRKKSYMASRKGNMLAH